MKISDAIYNLMLEAELFGQPVKLVGLSGRGGTVPRVSTIRDAVRLLAKRKFSGKSFIVYFVNDELHLEVDTPDKSHVTHSNLKRGSLISIVHSKMKHMVDTGIVSLDVTDSINDKLSYETFRVYVSRLRGDFFRDFNFGTSSSEGKIFLVIN